MALVTASLYFPLNQWKAQGVLVEKLRERLEAFRAGNAIQAQTIEGIAGNIAELFQVATQKGGENLLKPLVSGLNSFYEFLKANQGAIDEFFDRVTQAINNVITPLVQAADALADRFGTNLGNVLASSLDLAIQAFQGLGYAVAGTINAFVEFDKQVPFVSAQLQNMAEGLAMAADGWKKLRGAVDFYSGALADSDEATAQYEKQANQQLDTAQKVLQETAPRIQELQKKQKDGVTLTKSETEELAKLQARRSSAAAGLRSLSSTLGEASVVGEANQITLKGLITQLDNLAGSLTKTDLAARDLTNLGNTFKQLEDQANAAMRTIAEGGGGDQAKFQSAAKELIDLTAQQVELGALARTEGIKRLASIRDDQRTEIGVQQAAQKTITDIRKIEIDNQVKQVEQRIQSVQALTASEKLGEAASAAEVTRLKGEQLRLQLDAVRKSIAEEEKLKNSQLEANLKDLQAQYNAVAGADSPQAAALQKQVESSKTAVKASTASLKDLEAQYDAATESGDNFQAGILEAQITKARAASQENAANLKNFQSQYDAAIKGGDKKEAARLATQINNTKAAMALSSQRLTELKAFEKTLLSQATTNQAEAIKQRRAEELKDFDERQTRLQADYDRRLISESEFNRQSLEITKGKIQEELSQLAERRKTLLSTPKGKADTEGLEALATAEAKLRGELATSEEKAAVERYKMRQRHFEDSQMLLEYSLEKGEVTEEQYNKRSLTITQGKLQAELAEVKRQRKQIKSNDKQALEDLAAQEADIKKRQLEALEAYHEQQISLINDAANRAADAVTLNETKRLTQIQELENQRVISGAEADELRVNDRKKSLDEELAITKKQLADIEALPRPDNPEKAKERQDQINAIRLKAANLVKDLAENEESRQEALTRKIEEQIDLRLKAVQNAVAKENLGYERQSKLQEALSKSLEQQNSLLQIRKELGNSLLSYFQGELGILGQLADTESERQRFAETAATVKLRALKEQQEIELRILDVNLQQNQAALELEKIKNRQAQTQNIADIAQAKANITKTQASNLTPEQKQLQLNADLLSLRAKLQEGAGLAANQEFLDRKGAFLLQQYTSQLGNTRRSQQLETYQARAAQVEATINPTERNRRKKVLRDELLNDRFGTTNRGFVARQQKEYSRGEPGTESLFNTNTQQLAPPQPLPDFDTIYRNFVKQQGINPEILSPNLSLTNAISDLDATIQSTQSEIPKRLTSPQATQQTAAPANPVATPSTSREASSSLSLMNMKVVGAEDTPLDVNLVEVPKTPLNVKVVELPPSKDAATRRFSKQENTPTAPSALPQASTVPVEVPIKKAPPIQVPIEVQNLLPLSLPSAKLPAELPLQPQSNNLLAQLQRALSLAPVFNFEAPRSQEPPRPITTSASSNAELITVLSQLKTVMTRQPPPVVNQTNTTENHFDREGFNEREFAKKIEQQQRDAQYRVLQELQRRA